MTVYRVLSPISLGQTILAAGTIHRLAHLSDAAVAALIRRGAIGVASTPPLAALPGWTTRATHLEKLGVVTVADLLDADQATLDRAAKSLRRTPATLGQWQDEAARWLTVDGARPGG